MEEARQALTRIDEWRRRLQGLVNGESTPDKISSDKFFEALDDDLNISAALGYLFEQIRESNRELDAGVDRSRAQAWLEWWNKINRVLMLQEAKQGPPPEIAALAEARVQARLAKNWQKSDELRDAIQSAGWEVRDTQDGQVLTRRAGA
jgi:cysteinyl-tRNA synthetase